MTQLKIDPLFDVHMLNDMGKAKATRIALAFTSLLETLECDDSCGKGSREMAVVRTKLQEAAFFAKRAMAVLPQNQLPVAS